MAVPTQVVGLESGVVAISTGFSHSCAILKGGQAVCWGANNVRQLGDGTTKERLAPVLVSGVDACFVGISVGGEHTCAWTAAGQTYCWGGNSEGQIGSPYDGAQPPTFVPGIPPVLAVSSGYYHTCAVTSTKQVYCWGSNCQGASGSGTSKPCEKSNPAPTLLAGLDSGVLGLSIGANHTCAITLEGGATCWGDNSRGQLGNGSKAAAEGPQQVSGLDTGVAGIAAGDYHTCAVTASGAAKCWGDPLVGALGTGGTPDGTVPQQVSGLFAGVVGVSVGVYHSCAVTGAGKLWCWGNNTSGQLGIGEHEESSVPSLVVGF